VIVTEVPTRADVGARLVMAGGATTVKLTPLLVRFPRAMTTLPVVAPGGTVAVTEVALQFVIEVARTPLKLTVLLF
jgi:hypothetical protein